MASGKLETASKNMFGKKRFQDLIRRHHWLSAEDILNAIFGAMKNHTRGVRQDDDMTLVIIKVE